MKISWDETRGIMERAVARGLKEVLRHLWDCSGVREARRYFKEWATWCRGTGIKRVAKVVDMIKQRLDDVISSCKHPISTGPLEGMNSNIMAVRRAGRGYRHAETFGIIGRIPLRSRWPNQGSD